MDYSTVTENDFLGALCALQEYSDLSYLTNGPGFLIGVCWAWIENGGGDAAQKKLDKVLDERGYKRLQKRQRRSPWNDPYDGISYPPIFNE